MESRNGLPPRRGDQRAQEVRHQMERILADPFFSGANRRSRLLRYLVEQMLEDRIDALKESVIAAEVFDRPVDYDPQVDSVVRVEVGRLRSRLAEYYNTAGVDEPVRIEIPRGGYRPTFEFRNGVASPEAVGPVTEVAEAPATPPAPSVPDSRSKRVGSKKLVAVAAAAICVFAGWGIWRMMTSSRPVATIAVLPFLNLSGNAGDDYLGDSMTEELTEKLAEFSDLRVVSRTSAFQYKGKNVDAREIGRNLHASAVLEGSIARRDGQLHVVAQLVRTNDGIHLWSHAYDVTPAELTPAEANITGAARDALSPSPKPPRALSNDASTTRNPEAHDLYMRAAYALNQRTEASVRQSIALAQQAAAADPSFAQPWVAMAAGEMQLNTLLAQAPHAGAERAWDEISKALALDPGNSGAHAQRALMAYTDRWDWPQAEREFQLATAEGSHGSAENLYGWSLITRGRFKEARAHLQLAAELDPLSLGPQLNQVEELMAERSYGEARKKAEQLMAIAPRNPVAIALAANNAYWQRDCPGATSLSHKFLELYPQALTAHMAEVGAESICGQASKAEQDMAALMNATPASYVSPYSVAGAWAIDRKADKAMPQLEKSAEYREPVLMMLKVDRAFDSLRQDQRFIALERKLGLLD